MPKSTLKAIIFDLDGIITDTAEYHYLAWKRLADELGLPFNRKINERLRGVSRRESMLLILNSQPVTETQLEEYMARKNRLYRKMLSEITPAHLLPGVAELLDELDASEIPWAIASASRNAMSVLHRLGLTHRPSVIADGSTVKLQKPAPDLFRFTAARLGEHPGQCLVVEDAAAGIEAALTAGMPALAIGPPDRFAGSILKHAYFTRLDSLMGVTLVDLLATANLDDTWILSEDPFLPERQHQMETIFTIGNGYIATRGSFEESYPEDISITFAHGVYDKVPIAVSELANLPNWLDLTVTVNGNIFGLDHGRILHYHRRLDLKRAILSRDVRWQAPDQTILDLTFQRFICYTQEHGAALRLLVTAVNQQCLLSIETGINGHVENEGLIHWRNIGQGVSDSGAIWLHCQTRQSGIEVGAAARIMTTADRPVEYVGCPGQPRLVVKQTLSPGKTLQVDKLVSYTTSRDAIQDSHLLVERALAQLNGQTYDDLKQEHKAAWSKLWSDADVVIEGDDEVQLAIRFNLYHLLVAAPQRDQQVSIPAKTLSGFGYRGHVFWDTEIFVLPFFIFVAPNLARNMLLYRYNTLPGARRKAKANGFSGAQYAWESAATGDEVTPTWVPDFSGRELIRIWTGDIEIHITADIAYAVHQYWSVTGDDAFIRDYGAEIIFDTARFWGDRAELEDQNGEPCYTLRDVIGPDEYHDHIDNNAYTNRLVQWHLETALRLHHWLGKHYPETAKYLEQDLELTPERLALWQDVIDRIIILKNPETGLIHQFEGFFDLKPVTKDMIASAAESMQVLLGIKGANASQVIKQADVLMLLCLLRDDFDARTWQVNWDTYMPITDHRYGSSLGPSFHAWAACEIEQPEEAYKHLMLAARADLQDIRGNSGDGIHAASAGGLWQALVFGFAGLRINGAGYTLTPRLPSHWRRLSFKFYLQGKQKIVDLQQ